MTELQQLRVRALAQIAAKTESESDFIGKLNRGDRHRWPLSPKQAEWLAKLAWKYRRQMPKPLVPAQDPWTLGAQNVTEENETKTAITL